jgi:hypothetical protein
MLKRAKKLRNDIQRWCIRSGETKFQLSDDEWKHIHYILCLTKPFFVFTKVLSETKGVTIHNVFDIYNALFSHIDDAVTKLEAKDAPWKKDVLRALRKGESKLRRYYSDTKDPHGDVYAISTILAPCHKLQFFSGEDWEDGDWAGKYRQSLREKFDIYRSRLKSGQTPAQQARNTTSSSLSQVLRNALPSRRTQHTDSNELDRYLNSSKFVPFRS